MVPQAIHHALHAGDIDRTERLVSGSALPIILRGESRTLITSLEGLPPEIAKCKSLKNLDLRSTKIYKTDLPDLVALLPNTEILVTHGCSCKE